MAYSKQMGDLMLTLCVFLPALNLEKWKTGPLSDCDSEMTIPGQHFRSTPRNYWPLSQAESRGGGNGTLLLLCNAGVSYVFTW